MSLAIYITVTVIIIILMGVSAGTFFGLLSVDELDMEVSLISGDEKRKTEARKILQVIAKHHLLLVTLLIVNDSCMEILPIMLPEAIQDLDEIEISILCFVIIFIFGEIVPLALFSGQNQIKIASKIVPLVKI